MKHSFVLAALFGFISFQDIQLVIAIEHYRYKQQKLAQEAAEKAEGSSGDTDGSSESDGIGGGLERDIQLDDHHSFDFLQTEMEATSYKRKKRLDKLKKRKNDRQMLQIEGKGIFDSFAKKMEREKNERNYAVSMFQQQLVQNAAAAKYRALVQQTQLQAASILQNIELEAQTTAQDKLQKFMTEQETQKTEAKPENGFGFLTKFNTQMKNKIGEKEYNEIKNVKPQSIAGIEGNTDDEILASAVDQFNDREHNSLAQQNSIQIDSLDRMKRNLAKKLSLAQMKKKFSKQAILKRCN